MRTRIKRSEHGMTKTPEYLSWCSMKSRCYNQNAVGFKLWGGRGITVCDRWASSFENFLADMGPRPKGTSLDRINNDGNYEPGNCRWATRSEQRRNSRQPLSPPRPPRDAHAAKLNPAKVRVIRRCVELGMPAIEIGHLFGVSKGYAWMVANAPIWRDVKSADGPLSQARRAAS